MSAPTSVVMTINPVIAQVRQQLDQRSDQLMALLGPTIPLERFATVAMHAVNSNPDILRCTPLSIVEAIREAAALRLEPTGLLGDAYLVRYGDKARLMPGYRGLMKLARRSGEIRSIDTHVVYENDHFDVRLGSEPVVEHIPTLLERGNFRGAYAFAKLLSGELVVEWMSYADVEAVRKSSKASENGPWVAHWGEMARKSVIRRLMKRLPLTMDAERAIELDAEAENEPTRPTAPRSAALDKVRARLGIPASTEAPEPIPAAETTAPVDAAPEPESEVDASLAASDSLGLDTDMLEGLK